MTVRAAVRITRTVVAAVSVAVLLGAYAGYSTHLNEPYPTYEGD